MTGKETDAPAVEGGPQTEGLSEQVLASLQADPPDRVREENAPSGNVEEATKTLLGHAEAADNQTVAPDKEVAPETEEAPGEDFDDLPWDHKRQQRDQDSANLHKLLKRQGDKIELLTQRIEQGPPPDAELDAVLEELAEVVEPDPPEDYADDSEVAQYKAEVKKTRDQRAKLAAKAKDLRKKMVGQPAGKKSEEQEDEPNKSKSPTKDRKSVV